MLDGKAVSIPWIYNWKEGDGMLEALNKIFQGAQEGVNDTRVEFGNLLTVSPMIIKLDLDPKPLEPSEMEVLDQVTLNSADQGTRVAVLMCTNGQYLLLGKVK